MEILFLAAFAITFVFLLKISGKSRQERCLDQVPGPAGYPIVGNFFDIFKTKQEFLKLSSENEEKFGCLYKSWIGSTPIVFVSGPEHVEVLFGEKGTLRPCDPTSLITKSLITHPFATSVNRSITARAINNINPDYIIRITNENCQLLIDQLKKKSEGGDFLNHENVSLCIIDTISDLFLGVNPKTQSGENLSFANSLLRLIKLSGENHKIRYYNDSVFRLTSHGKEYFTCLNTAREFVDHVIGRKKAAVRGKCGEADILDDFIVYSGIYTIGEVRDEILNLIISAVQAIDRSVYSLLCAAGLHPNVQEKIRREMPKSRFASIKELQKAVNLDRAVKETLRLFPPCPFVVRELEKDAKLGDYTIPHGTTICVQLLNLEKNEYDPDNFPSRNSKNKTRCHPFGAGENNCLGQKPSEIIQRTILANLIASFEIIADRQQPGKQTITDCYIKQLNRQYKLRVNNIELT